MYFLHSYPTNAPGLVSVLLYQSKIQGNLSGSAPNMVITLQWENLTSRGTKAKFYLLYKIKLGLVKVPNYKLT